MSRKNDAMELTDLHAIKRRKKIRLYENNGDLYVRVSKGQYVKAYFLLNKGYRIK